MRGPRRWQRTSQAGRQSQPESRPAPSLLAASAGLIADRPQDPRRDRGRMHPVSMTFKAAALRAGASPRSSQFRQYEREIVWRRARSRSWRASGCARGAPVIQCARRRRSGREPSPRSWRRPGRRCCARWPAQAWPDDEGRDRRVAARREPDFERAERRTQRAVCHGVDREGWWCLPAGRGDAVSEASRCNAAKPAFRSLSLFACLQPRRGIDIFLKGEQH